MKKILSSMLAFSLLTSVGAPAFAAEEVKAVPAAREVAESETGPATAEAAAAETTLDARLAEVTKKVKSVLPIGDDFPQFYGEPNDNGKAPRWDLSWSNDSESITVTAGEDGKVYSYNYNASDSGNRYYGGLNAAFPKVDQKEALAAAQAFADGLMGKNESVKLEAADSGRNSSPTFTGTLLFHGLPSPVDVRISLRAEDLAVIRYRRGDSYSSTNPDIPSPNSKTSAAQAASLLRSTIELVPYYVREDGKKIASLRYVRKDEKNYIVTDDDGKLVNVDEVYSDLVAGYSDSSAFKMENGTAMTATQSEDAAAPSPSDSGGSARLSDAEFKTVDGMKDVHSRDQLDDALRNLTALGLDESWALEKVNYSQDRESGDISARLRYTRPLTDAEKEDLEGDYEGELLQVNKTVVMNARTDELQSVYTANYYLSDRARAQREGPQSDEQRAAAEAFLKEQLPEKWKQSDVYTREKDNRLMYAQKISGYLFPDNLITIRMDENNIVDSLNVSWDDSISFTGANGIISAEEAVDACMKAFEMPLSYVEFPVLENRVMGQKYVLAYAFRYEANRVFAGINAKTGEAVWQTYGSSSEYSYSDLEGASGRREIEALAAFGIGLSESKFQPNARLDQKTMLVLLLSACGYELEPVTKDTLDDLYSYAYNENLLKAADRSPDAEVTRMGFLRTLIDASSYGDAAKVQGIYSCPFADRSDIAEADIGYAALSYGLGVFRGNNSGRLEPDNVMTRQDAAVMLYNFMMR